MKILKGIIGISCILFFVAIGSAKAQTTLSIGDQLPMVDHSVTDVNSRSVNLAGSAGENGLIVVFVGNTCPWVSRWETRLKLIAGSARTNGIGIIALNPNERIRERGESLAEMKRRSSKQTYNFTYALDQDHILADAFGATKVPEVFLFDSDLKLVFKGSIDDNPRNASAVENQYLQNAIDSVLSQGAILNPETEVKGCTIKRIR